LFEQRGRQRNAEARGGFFFHNAGGIVSRSLQ
jgi:hypothetical protein